MVLGHIAVPIGRTYRIWGVLPEGAAEQGIVKKCRVVKMLVEVIVLSMSFVLSCMGEKLSCIVGAYLRIKEFEGTHSGETPIRRCT